MKIVCLLLFRLQLLSHKAVLVHLIVIFLRLFLMFKILNHIVKLFNLFICRHETHWYLVLLHLIAVWSVPFKLHVLILNLMQAFTRVFFLRYLQAVHLDEVF